MRYSLFIFVLILTWGHPGQAFDLASGLTPPNKQRTLLDYTGLFHDSSDVAQERAAISYQAINFSTPVSKTETEAVSVFLGANQLSLTPPQSNYSELFDLKFGLAYTRALDANRLWSVSTRYGSASDKPFADSTVSTFGITGFYSFSNDETSRWLLLVDYSNNRPILNNLPLPGFAYFYSPSKDLRAVVGAPFASLNWSYTEKWILELFTIVPWIFKGSLGYKINDYARVYTGVDFSQVTYYLYGRQNTKERLFFDEKKMFVGIKSPLSKSIFAELEAGHAFDRSLFIAENYKINPDNPVDIGNAFYGKLSLRFLF